MLSKIICKLTNRARGVEKDGKSGRGEKKEENTLIDKHMKRKKTRLLISFTQSLQTPPGS